jgi:hypothetical protein
MTGGLMWQRKWKKNDVSKFDWFMVCWHVMFVEFIKPQKMDLAWIKDFVWSRSIHYLDCLVRILSPSEGSSTSSFSHRLWHVELFMDRCQQVDRQSTKSVLHVKFYMLLMLSMLNESIDICGKVCILTKAFQQNSLMMMREKYVLWWHVIWHGSCCGRDIVWIMTWQSMWWMTWRVTWRVRESLWRVKWHADMASTEGDMANLVIETNTTWW